MRNLKGAATSTERKHSVKQRKIVVDHSKINFNVNKPLKVQFNETLKKSSALPFAIKERTLNATQIVPENP